MSEITNSNKENNNEFKDNLNINKNTNINGNERNDDLNISNLQVEVLPESLMSKSKTDLTFKLIMLGNAGVGKSSLSLKGTTGRFNENYVATVAFDFFSFFTKINGETIRLQIWDTCGMEKTCSLIQNFYKGTSLAILVYAINDTDSFNDVAVWVKQLRNYAAVDIKMFLIANKCDLEEQRQISKEEGLKYQKDLDFYRFFETSAKSGKNSQEIFIEATKILYSDFKKKTAKINKISKMKDNNIISGDDYTIQDANIRQSVGRTSKLSKELLKKDKKRNRGCCN